MKIIAIGAGHRLQDSLLPVLELSPNNLELIGIFARSKRNIFSNAHTYLVQELSSLSSDTLSSVEFIYCAISPDEIPNVLRHIIEIGTFKGVFIIETPALKLSHLHCINLFDNFNKVVCSEDMIFLPWIDTLEKAAQQFSLGVPDFIELDRSGWEYHGIALLKRIFNNAKVLRSSRIGNADILKFSGGRVARIVNPRNYDTGNIRIGYQGKIVSSRKHPDTYHLYGFTDANGKCGFQINDVCTYLSEEEALIFSRMKDTPREFNIVKHMHDCKRVGFSRLISRILSGEVPYTTIDSINDELVCLMNSKLGWWFRSPVTIFESKLSKYLLGFVCQTNEYMHKFQKKHE